MEKPERKQQVMAKTLRRRYPRDLGTRQDPVLGHRHRDLRPHLRLRAFQHPFGLDDPDPADRRLPLRLEDRLWLQQVFLPWGLAPFEGRVWEDAPKRGDVVVFRPPGDARHRFHQARDRPSGRPRPDEAGRALHQRRGGRSASASRTSSITTPDDPKPPGAAIHGDSARRRFHRDHRDRRATPASYDNTPVFVVPQRATTS